MDMGFTVIKKNLDREYAALKKLIQKPNILSCAHVQKFL